MQNLCQITVPGLEVAADWRLVHDRLLDEFPEVTDVLATTMKGTILILYGGPAHADASSAAHRALKEIEATKAQLDKRWAEATREFQEEANRVRK